MAWISAETGTLVFASINIVAATLSSAFGIGALIYWAAMVLVIDARPRSPPEVQAVVQYLVSIIIWIAFALLGLVFSSFLLNGILKKRAEHIKAYYVFGLVMVFLTMLVLFSFSLCPAFQQPDQPQTVAALLFFFSYSLILYMVRITYKNLETNEIQFGHKPLVGKC